jgi:hypothetical protein
MTRSILRGRALLFVALSGVAVPACQHNETTGTPDRDQAVVRLTLPSVTQSGAAGSQSAAPRA